MRLSSAGDNILSDSALVENLEHTKKTAAEIEIKVAEAKKTSFEIDKAREFYRPAAARYFLNSTWTGIFLGQSWTGGGVVGLGWAAID